MILCFILNFDLITAKFQNLSFKLHMTSLLEYKNNNYNFFFENFILWKGLIYVMHDVFDKNN